MELSKEILGLVSDIHDSLRTRGETLSTAESLTAGGLSNALTIVPGASDVFLGSLTAYQLSAKKLQLLWGTAPINHLVPPGRLQPLASQDLGHPMAPIPAEFS